MAELRSAGQPGAAVPTWLVEVPVHLLFSSSPDSGLSFPQWEAGHRKELDNSSIFSVAMVAPDLQYSPAIHEH
jgi:hypothetical protein